MVRGRPSRRRRPAAGRREPARLRRQAGRHALVHRPPVLRQGLAETLAADRRCQQDHAEGPEESAGGDETGDPERAGLGPQDRCPEGDTPKPMRRRPAPRRPPLRPPRWILDYNDTSLAIDGRPAPRTVEDVRRAVREMTVPADGGRTPPRSVPVVPTGGPDVTWWPGRCLGQDVRHPGRRHVQQDRREILRRRQQVRQTPGPEESGRRPVAHEDRPAHRAAGHGDGGGPGGSGSPCG